MLRRTCTGLRIDTAEARHRPDAMLVGGPVRPHERLVVEGRGDEARQPIEECQPILVRGPTGVDRAQLHSLDQRLQRRTRIGIMAGAQPQIEDGVRLFGAGGADAARTVIFETATDDTDVVGEQLRRDRIAGEARVMFAIECKPQGLAAIDRTAFGQTQGLAHASGSEPVTTCVTVSRDSTNQRPQPALWIHSSRSDPLTLVRKYT